MRRGVPFRGILVGLTALATAPCCRAAGTVSVCDLPHFLTALQGGGSVNFSCSGTIELTSTILDCASTSISEAAQNVTIAGNGTFGLMEVLSGVELDLTSLTLSGGNAGGGGAVLLAGGVTGNVVVQGGDFELRYANVGGNVDGDSTFSIGPSANISGNLEIHDLASGAAQSQVCGANITWNLEVHNNAAAVAIGVQDQTTCLGNTFGGSLEAHNNSAATTVDGNTVTGDLDDHDNLGQTQVFNNLVTRSRV